MAISSRAKLICGGVLAAMLVSWMFADLSETDWNPLIHTSEELEGNWREGDSVLSLKSNGEYVCSGKECGSLAGAGTWQRSGDFYVDFSKSGQLLANWRFVRRNNVLVFAEGPDLESLSLRYVHDASNAGTKR